MREEPTAGLTPRQRDVLQLLARGLTNQEIADVLSVSIATVRTHVTAVLAALDVTNRTEAAALFTHWESAPERVAEVLDRPAIAVLPLGSPPGEARVASVAAGLTLDLTNLLARWSWFPVIVSPTALTGSPLEHASRLRAQFLLDGALRPAGAGWRLDLRVHDGAGGHVLWAERFDFPLDELFLVQDALTAAIVATIYPVLVATLHSRLPRVAAPEGLSAWERAHLGLRLQAARERMANAEARACFETALKAEGGMVLAHFGLGLTAYDEVLNQWGPAGEADARLVRCAERCLEFAPHAAEGHFLLARWAQTRGDHAGAERHLQAAVARNPSFAPAHALLAQVVLLNGRTEEGLVRLQQAARLAPNAYLTGLGVAHFLRREYAEALALCEQALATNPGYPFGLLLAAACAWWQGDTPGATTHYQALRRLHPSFAPQEFLRFGSVEGVTRIFEAAEALSRTS